MASHPLRVLSLCSGYGGLDLAVRLVFPGARTVCYVEREIPCARILASRMAEGALEPAPIWSDVSTFDGSRWAGCVDLIVAGFPCQPHSLAGKREGTADARWPVWDDIIRIARECSTRAIFLENVPGLLTSSGGASIARVRSDLDGAGFTLQTACVVGAGDVGASHRRDRLFILANAQHIEQHWSGNARGRRNESADIGGAMANADRQWQSQCEGHVTDIRRWAGDECQTMAHTSKPGLEGWPVTFARHECQAPQRSGYGLFAPGPDADWSAIDPGLWPATTKPPVCGVDDGTPRRLDITRSERLRALGNGVVPLQAAVALRHLIEQQPTP